MSEASGTQGHDAGLEPVEAAQRYVDERIPNSGWKVDEVMGNIDFAMVTVVLGQYLKSGDVVHRAAGREGHGTTIEAAVEDALGHTE